MHQVWRLSEYGEDNLGLACTEHGLVLGRTPLVERRDGRFAVRERSEIECLLSRAYRAELPLQRLMTGLGNVASALNANDPCLARIAAVHLKIPDLPNQAARDDMEAADALIKSGDWNPALHPRTGTPPNPGWFAPTGGAGGESSSARTAQTTAPEDIHVAAINPIWELLFGPGKEPFIEGGGANRGRGGSTEEPVVPPKAPPAVAPAPQEQAPSLGNILAPGGEPIGEVYPGATPEIRTVSPAEFEALESELLSGAIPVSAPDTYDGMVFERPDGSLIGIRNSDRYGITLDVIKSTSPKIENGFRIHQR